MSPKKSYMFFYVLALFGLIVFAGWFSKQRNICANSITCIKNLDVDVENDAVGVFNGKEIVPPKITLTEEDKKTRVLGDETATGEKHIYVDLTKQALYAYQGDTLYMEAPVSTGKWHPTPIGEFRIWVKLRATRMSGGSGADYYNLPNVPYTMFFSGPNAGAGAGFSLHGAYWHDNFGHAMSHGCVNMREVDAHKLYDWVTPVTSGYTTHATESDPGTKITIYGAAL